MRLCMQSRTRSVEMTNQDVLAELQKIELTEDELEKVVGGVEFAEARWPSWLPSAGWVCTISGECSVGGGSCNPF